MSRIPLIEQASANDEQKALLDAIETQLGMVPNFLKVFANSPVALRAFLGLHGVANAGSLDAMTRERIALTLAQQNECEYCVSAHTAIGHKSGLTSAEIGAARAGNSADARAQAALTFARSLMDNRGEISTLELAAMRSAGYSESDIVEVITHVGMNFLTNILGKASRVAVDFPKVSLQLAA